MELNNNTASNKNDKTNKDILEFGKCFYLLFNNISKPVYRSHIINTLIGTKKDLKVLLVDKRHKAYGCLSSYTYKQVKKMLFFLSSKKCISVIILNEKFLFSANPEELELMLQIDYSEFSNFSVPKDEFAFLSNLVNKPNEDDTEKITRRMKRDKRSNINLTNFDKEIYNELTKLRKAIANGLHVLPYIICQNSILEEIALLKPKSVDEMLKIKGMGDTRYNKYGKFFLEKLLEILNEKELNSNENFKLSEQSRFLSRKTMMVCYNKNKKEDFLKDNQAKELELLEIKRQELNAEFVEQTKINEKNYLDKLLIDLDSKIVLDEKQREVVLRDEDYTLVVAGAGAGKTTTIAAKVKYLVEKQSINPEDILIVSYTNDAVNELKDRINKSLNIPARISTFHKVGYSIIRKQKDAEKMQIAHDGAIFNVIRDYLKSMLRTRPEDLKSMVLFFGYYIDPPIGTDSLEGFISHFQRNDYTTLKENLEEITFNMIDSKAKIKVSIKEEVMRSLEEVQIANFLYLHNIDYDYEKVYPYHIIEASKLYTPDFTISIGNRVIYLEHFGISESGLNSRYSNEQLELYKKHINDKVLLHKSKGTKLIFTFSNYSDGRSLISHLQELLESEGIKLVERPIDEVYKKIIEDEDNKYFNKLIFLIKDFISSFKINGYSEKDFASLESKTDNVRNRLFLKIIKPVYLHYQSYLLERDMLDFEDMINESSQILTNPETKELIPDFKYVIVDEYQDISMQRFDLTKSLAKLTNAKIIAVGDDWQSIFAFAGSRVDLFLKFKDLFGYADYLTIDYTYRNAQQLIDSAGKFIQKNDNQLKKQLKSPKSIEFPIVMYEYNDIVYKNDKKGYKGILHEKAKLCDEILKELFNEYGQKQTIALLGRYNFEIERLSTTEFFAFNKKGHIKSVNYPQLNLKFMTIHSSKGLGFDNVIILNGSDEVFGFPSQLEMDPILKLVKYDDQTISYAEERRLFYVALTRTKNKVYLLYPTTKPSAFVKELTKGYSTVRFPKSINQHIPIQDRKDKRCPICGYPIQLKKNKAYGLKLYMCTNEPELCGYLTNNLRSGKKSVRKCPDCRTGFLIVKHSIKNDNYFFGCTNYEDNGKGCNHSESLKDIEL